MLYVNIYSNFHDNLVNKTVDNRIYIINDIYLANVTSVDKSECDLKTDNFGLVVTPGHCAKIYSSWKVYTENFKRFMNKHDETMNECVNRAKLGKVTSWRIVFGISTKMMW